MGNYDAFSKKLKKALKYSNTVGKLWLTVLVIFRILVLGAAAEKVWGSEDSKFLCDTGQPGCSTVCYDKTFPISHLHFWAIQVIIVSTPTLIYLGHVIYQDHINENKNKGKEMDSKGKLYLNKKLFKTYVLNIVFKTVLEVGFLVAQYCLYGFGLKSMYVCSQWPCLNPVFCYISRPTEKTVFIIYMLVVTCVSLLLNLAEMIHVHSEKKNEGNGLDTKKIDTNIDETDTSNTKNDKTHQADKPGPSVTLYLFVERPRSEEEMSRSFLRV